MSLLFPAQAPMYALDYPMSVYHSAFEKLFITSNTKSTVK